MLARSWRARRLAVGAEHGSSLHRPPQGAPAAGAQTEGMNKLSLDALVREQMARAFDAPGGHSAETVYGGHEHALRQTVIALTAGSAQRSM